MTTPKHTPGPWIYSPTAKVIYSDEGHANVARPCEFGEQSETPNAQDANARLIAAAPDLLEALRKMVRSAESAYHVAQDKDPHSPLNIARAAIAKAEGRS